MMSKTEVTADMVHQLLASGWIEETRQTETGDPQMTGRKRTRAAVSVKKLYSETKKKSYPGLVYLTDEGPSSQFGAGFGLQEILHEAPVSLGKCPRCGRDVIEGKNGYGCSGYKDGCRFIIWKKSKFGIMCKTTVTKSAVKTLLKSGWVSMNKNTDDQTPEKGRRRTEKTIPSGRLWSEEKQRLYSGEVFLYDDGPDGKYGAAFGLARVIYDGPERLGICPRCGKPVIEGRLGYGCSGYKEGCRFSIWKNAKQKLLANVSFTKTDAKRFLSGKTVVKSKLVDKKGRLFKAALRMIEEADNPFGPVFRVVEGTIEPEAGIATDIVIETVPAPEENLL